ncbi:MAG: alcohol dehydrogenase [Zetaproteobacteria bacterium]|nr:MAG: alcohol dehydrogenase [Zetaproteobacteria bacterium]
MRAVVMRTTGSPEVLELKQCSRPEPAGDELLIRIKAAGVNPIDTKLRKRGLYFGNPPAILGCDGAGVVERVGDRVNGFGVGDRVYYCFGGLGQSCGNYAEYAAVPSRYVAHMPNNLDFAHAAAAPLVLITAWEALFDRARMRAGQRVFIHAGAGGVGHVAIQLARIAGCSVATTVSDDTKAELVRHLGADYIIRYREQDVTRALMEWTQGEGVDIALDTVGGAAFHALVPAVRIYGDLVTLLQVPADTDWKTLRLRNIRLSQELMLSPMVFDLDRAARHQAQILKQCAQWFEQGQLSVHLADILPLEHASEAHRRIETGHMCGKLVLQP